MWITHMTGYYNLGTTTYYNVPYMEQSKASMGVITDITFTNKACSRIREQKGNVNNM